MRDKTIKINFCKNARHFAAVSSRFALSAVLIFSDAAAAGVAMWGLLSIVPPQVQAASRVMNFQGRLTNTSNNPQTGSFDFKFRLFDAPSGGNQLWPTGGGTEDQTLPVTNGVFSAQVGSVTPIPLSAFQVADGTDVYLEIQVQGETLSPRQKMLSVPYAMTLMGRTTDHFLDVSGSTQTKTGGLNVTGGNLGIGTDAPSAKLQVYRAAGAVGPQVVVSTGATNLFEVNGTSIVARVPMYFQSASGTASGSLDSSASTQTKTGGLNVMGRIGIGSDIPESKLNIVADNGFFGTVILQTLTAGNNVAGIYLKNRNSQAGNAQGGFVAYGNSDAGLDLYQSRLVLSATANSSAGTGTKGIAVSLQGASEGAQDFRIVNGNSLAGTILTVQQGGNVGIGTVTPGALMDVQGAAQFGSGNVNLIDSTGKIAALTSTYIANLSGAALTSVNADTLDSVDSTLFVYGTNAAKSIGNSTANPDSVFAQGSGFIDVYQAGGTYPSGTSHIHGFQTRHHNLGGSWGVQVATQYSLTNKLYFRTINAGSWNPWRQLINDGDSYADPAWITSLAGSKITGSISVTGTATTSGAVAANGGVTVDGLTVIDDGAGWMRTYGNSGWFNGTYAGGWYMQDTSYIRAYNGKTVLAPAFADESNAGYILDPAGTSNLNVMRWQNVDCIAGYCPTSTAIRMTPNLHLNSTGGDTAVILNWDNGASSSGAVQRFRVGNGVGTADVFYVRADGGFMGNIFYDLGNTGYYVDPNATSNINTMTAVQVLVNGAAGAMLSVTAGTGATSFSTTNTGSSWGIYCSASNCGGSSAWQNTSDRRLKTEIRPLTNTLNKIMKLEGVSYHWRSPNRDAIEGEKIGLIAQNVEEVFPQAVKIDPDTKDPLPGGTKVLSYTDLIAPMVQAIKELRAEKDGQIESLLMKNKQLEDRLKKLEERK